MDKPTNAGLPSESIGESLAAIEAAASTTIRHGLRSIMPTQTRTATPTDGAQQCTGYEANCIGDIQRASSFSARLMSKVAPQTTPQLTAQRTLMHVEVHLVPRKYLINMKNWR
ncbi:hypothetical protein L6654_42570 [Bradyrhizobium sp. WYCCWR 13023]|uniref:Uncharacterized protein n=1 Tax=Bradyrhizobium zhengyangense TaxID=2911009 RepID=A0A9X1RI89_9BRAD|nr:hypothetical protein [Bradyrhizobium zhengyangense]MCG2633201.1 hypothetical protein [Bradyrhizobium zhengyangense]MCG2672309.1 hypothetical protein [Bradyrhizobium zhengyangense]